MKRKTNIWEDTEELADALFSIAKYLEWGPVSYHLRECADHMTSLYEHCLEQEKELKHSVVMPIDEEYSMDETIKSMILGGFSKLTENSTYGERGCRMVELEFLFGYLAGVVDAGLEMQKQLLSYKRKSL